MTPIFRSIAKGFVVERLKSVANHKPVPSWTDYLRAQGGLRG